MNSTIILALSTIFVFILLFIAYKKFTNYRHITGAHAADNKTAQESYYKKKHQDDEKRMTLQERIELSWKFLYEITELILYKFSPQDRKAVEDAGRVLTEKGMKYEHVVELGIRHDKAHAANISKEERKDDSKNKSAAVAR